MKRLYRYLMNRTIRRWKLGFNPEDIWALDTNLAEWLLPRLRHLKKVKRGIPAVVFFKDDPDKECSMDRAQQLWDSIMDDIIYYWEFVGDNYRDGMTEFDEDKINRGAEYFMLYIEGLCD